MLQLFVPVHVCVYKYNWMTSLTYLWKIEFYLTYLVIDWETLDEESAPTIWLFNQKQLP